VMDPGRRADDAGPTGGASGTDRRRLRPPTGRHRRGDGPGGVGAHDHVRVRAHAVPRRPRPRPLPPRRPPTLPARAAPALPRSRSWTRAAERMTQGRPAGPVGPTDGDYDLPPDDTGEAMDLAASGLTITFGFGPTLFRDDHGRDRFGLAGRRPSGLEPLPHFPDLGHGPGPPSG